MSKSYVLAISSPDPLIAKLKVCSKRTWTYTKYATNESLVRLSFLRYTGRSSLIFIQQEKYITSYVRTPSLSSLVTASLTPFFSSQLPLPNTPNSSASQQKQSRKIRPSPAGSNLEQARMGLPRGAVVVAAAADAAPAAAVEVVVVAATAAAAAAVTAATVAAGTATATMAMAMAMVMVMVMVTTMTTAGASAMVMVVVVVVVVVAVASATAAAVMVVVAAAAAAAVVAARGRGRVRRAGGVPRVSSIWTARYPESPSPSCLKNMYDAVKRALRPLHSNRRPRLLRLIADVVCIAYDSCEHDLFFKQPRPAPEHPTKLVGTPTFEGCTTSGRSLTDTRVLT